MNEKVRKLVTMAMLAALSIVLVYVIHFPIFPAASFLEYDPADIPILIGTFAYGPLAGVLLTVVVSVIQGMTVSSGSGLMGIAMHIFATSILVLCGVLAMTAGMVVFNYFITPYFITPDLADTAAVAANREFVKTLLVPVIVPFNLIKAGVNSVVTFLVYKTVSRHLVHGENWKKEPGVKQAQPEQ